MPRVRKNLAPQAPGMEAGAGYGEQGQNLAAQNPAQGGIPLPDRSAPPGAPPPPPLPVEQATSFTPGITPLTAPGLGNQQVAGTGMLPATNMERAAGLLARWAEATGDPRIFEAAALLTNG